MARTKAFDEQKVLNKAMELFWQKGFHATSIQDLVDHLGINRASMYDTFGGKEQLFMQALQLYLSQYSTDVGKLREVLRGKSVKEFLREYAFRDLEKKEVLDQNGCFATNATAELSKENKQVCSVLSDNMDRNVKFFEVVIRLGQERREINRDKDSYALARHLFVFFNGLKVVSKLKPKESLCSVVDAQLDFLFEH